MATAGSGKTLAYLLPVIERLKRDELERMVVARPGRPRAIVLVPTRELAHQVKVGSVCCLSRRSSGLLSDSFTVFVLALTD